MILAIIFKVRFSELQKPDLCFFFDQKYLCCSFIYSNLTLEKGVKYV